MSAELSGKKSRAGGVTSHSCRLSLLTDGGDDDDDDDSGGDDDKKKELIQAMPKSKHSFLWEVFPLGLNHGYHQWRQTIGLDSFSRSREYAKSETLHQVSK